MVRKIVFYIALLGVLLFGETIHAQKSPEQLLDEINRLPASERQKRLEEGARKEGEACLVLDNEPRRFPPVDAGFREPVSLYQHQND